MKEAITILYNLFIINIIYKFFKKNNFILNSIKFLFLQNELFNKIKELEKNKEKKINIIILKDEKNINEKFSITFKTIPFFNTYCFNKNDNSNSYYFPNNMPLTSYKNFLTIINPTLIIDLTNSINLNLIILCKKNNITYYKILNWNSNFWLKIFLKFLAIKYYSLSNEKFLIENINNQFYYARN